MSKDESSDDKKIPKEYNKDQYLLMRELMAMKRDGLFYIKAKEFYIPDRSALMQVAND